MQFLLEYGLFLAKALTLVFAILAVVVGVMVFGRRDPEESSDSFRVHRLNDRYDAMREALSDSLMPRKALRKQKKAKRKEKKAAEKKQEADDRKRIFVLDFKGDIRASAVDGLRDEVTAIITSAREGDEVFLRLESPGGQVHGYGLAASQLARLREKNIKLIAAVDKVAASGGYLMASVADRIIAAPFAIVGSIGVLAQIPNFHRLLKKQSIDFEQFTAGEYKRNVTMFGENTDEHRAKLREELEDTHELFKDYVSRHRPQLELAKVATGEHWYGSQALDLGLIDEIKTSDDWLLEASEEAELLKVNASRRKSFKDRFLKMAHSLAETRTRRDLGAEDRYFL